MKLVSSKMTVLMLSSKGTRNADFSVVLNVPWSVILREIEKVNLKNTWQYYCYLQRTVRAWKSKQTQGSFKIKDNANKWLLTQRLKFSDFLVPPVF